MEWKKSGFIKSENKTKSEKGKNKGMRRNVNFDSKKGLILIFEQGSENFQLVYLNLRFLICAKD